MTAIGESCCSTFRHMADFLFYASFGLVITHSVRMSGVLVVFAILVIPSTLSAIFANSWGVR
ncbi:MAG: metal ABC transporter permease, partial [Promethearchaeota archaeon]